MKPNDKVLKGKVAVITGAGRGIGKAIAVAYAKAGASIVCAARTTEEIEETANEIAKIGERALAVKTDVTCIESVNIMLDKAVEHFGGIDIVVINAGANYDRETVEDSNQEDWKRTLEVNLFGAYYCAHSAIPFLKRRGAGKIITIGSGLGHRGYVGGSAYSCSKAGLWILTRILAQELLPYNISVSRFNFRVAGLIFNDKRLLVHGMKKDDFYALPGGWAEMMESTEMTIVREMKEELNIDVRGHKN